ncbi:galactokinase [Lapillicoccus jejuensis]|uniref:Galactokinase n=1 Tax=Lapillicoccus jejuensis TaxID=402171 RepID=A0A542E2E5_9MICO|nr:galactokinase [Lapillicoccus jejuensis]TQJ09404.1 galactokinase [Lapillicoccus jejuensis]
MPDAAQTTARFSDLHGGEPSGVWSAPGRVNLIGEHTDYNGGLALPIALTQRTRAAVRLREDGLLRVTSDISDDPVEVAVADVDEQRPGGWASYVAGVLWSFGRQGHPVPGADVHVSSDVPVGAGLSSSAAIECAVAAGLDDLLGVGLLADDAGRARLASWCQDAENTIAGAQTGGMDQAISLRGQEAHAALIDCRSGEVEQVPFDLAGHDLALLVVDTKAQHELNDGQYAVRRATCEAAARTLGVGTLREVPVSGLDEALGRLEDDESRARVRHVVMEIDRVERCVAALRGDDYAQVGRLFVASHASLRDDYEVSCLELDVAVDAALAAGALGARMTGGGFGGSAIALVPAGSVDAVTAAVEAAFAERGLHAPACFAVTAGPPAGRDA